MMPLTDRAVALRQARLADLLAVPAAVAWQGSMPMLHVGVMWVMHLWWRCACGVFECAAAWTRIKACRPAGAYGWLSEVQLVVFW